MLLLAWAELPEQAAAALPLRVLARTSLTLEAKGDVRGVVLGGRLTDDLGRGLPERTVRLRVDGGASIELRTDRRGWLPGSKLALELGTHRVAGSFAGDELGYAPSQSELMVQVQPPAPRLELTLPPRIGPGEPLRLSARATLGKAPLPDLPLHWLLDGRPVGTAATDAAGQGTLRLAASDVGRHGPHRVVVQTPASAELSGATASGTVVRQVPVELELAASVEQGLLEDRVELGGRLAAEGEALPGRLLQLEWGGGAPPRETATDAQGRFAVSLDPGLFPPASIVNAGFAGEQGLLPARAEARLVLPPPRPSPLPRALAVSAVALLLAASVLAGRWLAGLRQRRAKAETHSGVPRPEDERPPPLPVWARLEPDSGWQTGDPLQIRGLLWDRIDDRPICGGALRLVPCSADRAAAGGALPPTTTSQEGGRFLLPAPCPGIWTLHASAPGYLDEALPLELPSAATRGPVRLGLLPVREAVRQIWLEQASVQHPTARPIWGRLTPAQVLARLVRPPSWYTGLTRLMEQVYYAAGPHSTTAFTQARALAAGEGGDTDTGGGSQPRPCSGREPAPLPGRERGEG